MTLLQLLPLLLLLLHSLLLISHWFSSNFSSVIKFESIFSFSSFSLFWSDVKNFYLKLNISSQRQSRNTKEDGKKINIKIEPFQNECKAFPNKIQHPSIHSVHSTWHTIFTSENSLFLYFSVCSFGSFISFVRWNCPLPITTAMPASIESLLYLPSNTHWFITQTCSNRIRIDDWNK